MKIHFLGTCAGTEPIPDMHHCSLVFEVNGVYYWFDAGENCSHTAYTKMGIDLSRVRSVFICHPYVSIVSVLAAGDGLPLYPFAAYASSHILTKLIFA